MDRHIEVLILEDDPSDAELVERELRKAGLDFAARWAQDKRAFLQALDASAPDLVLADYSLPGFDGMAALALARERFPEVPVVIVSGAIGEEIAIEALKSGATDYVLKNHLSRLGPVVRRALQEADLMSRRNRAEQALQESEERFRLLVEAVKDYAIIMLDPEGRVVTWNAGAERLKGYKAHEIISQHFSRFHIPEDVAAGKPQRELAAAAEHGRSADEGWRLRQDGSRFWASAAITAIHDEAGQLRGFVKITRDISDRKRMEDELRAARDAAELANRAKDHFLAVLSHELRTPLTPVQMGVSMLHDRPDLDPTVRETLEIVGRHVEMESRLIDDLLDVTRIARGKIELHQQQADLSAILGRAAEVCKADIESRGLRFGVDLGSDSPYWIKADVARLQQVFWNLLKNAIKFTPHGGHVRIRVRKDEGEEAGAGVQGSGFRVQESPVSLSAKPGTPDPEPQTLNPEPRTLNPSVVVEVTDNGIGIEPEALSRIFNAFEQADRSITRQFGGLGLGLAISKAMVHMHGGTIEAQSEGRNRGATFRIRLPLAAPGSPADAPPAASPGRGAVRPLRILLVEDHGVTAKMMRWVLNEEGHQVETVGDVATALTLADEQPFDLLISDLGLPDGSGHDLMRQLRRRGHRFPAIALSGYGQEEDIQQSHEAGFAAHLIKPASRERLLGAVASAAADPPATPRYN